MAAIQQTLDARLLPGAQEIPCLAFFDSAEPEALVLEFNGGSPHEVVWTLLAALFGPYYPQVAGADARVERNISGMGGPYVVLHLAGDGQVRQTHIAINQAGLDRFLKRARDLPVVPRDLDAEWAALVDRGDA